MIDVEKFRAARAAAKLSQTKLAKAAGVSQQLITEIEAGRTRSTKSIYKLAKALNMKAHELDDDIPAPSAEWEETMNEVTELAPEDQEYALRNLREFINLVKNRRP